MKLYDCTGAVNPRRIRMFLAEKGMSVEYSQVNIFKGEQHEADFAAINPLKVVPCLELDDGEVIAESAAIARYFEALQPQPALMGESPKEQAMISMWQRRVEENLLGSAIHYFHHSTSGLGEADRYRNAEWGNVNKTQISTAMRWIDKELEQRDYIAGNTYSFADITTLCAIDFAKFLGVDIPAECANLLRWYGAVSARPSAAA